MDTWVPTPKHYHRGVSIVPDNPGRSYRKCHIELLRKSWAELHISQRVVLPQEAGLGGLCHSSKSRPSSARRPEWNPRVPSQHQTALPRQGDAEGRAPETKWYKTLPSTKVRPRLKNKKISKSDEGFHGKHLCQWISVDSWDQRETAWPDKLQMSTDVQQICEWEFTESILDAARRSISCKIRASGRMGTKTYWQLLNNFQFLDRMSTIPPIPECPDDQTKTSWQLLNNFQFLDRMSTIPPIPECPDDQMSDRSDASWTIVDDQMSYRSDASWNLCWTLVSTVADESRPIPAVMKLQFHQGDKAGNYYIVVSIFLSFTSACARPVSAVMVEVEIGGEAMDTLWSGWHGTWEWNCVDSWFQCNSGFVITCNWPAAKDKDYVVSGVQEVTDIIYINDMLLAHMPSVYVSEVVMTHTTQSTLGSLLDQRSMLSKVRMSMVTDPLMKKMLTTHWEPTHSPRRPEAGSSDVLHNM